MCNDILGTEELVALHRWFEKPWVDHCQEELSGWQVEICHFSACKHSVAPSWLRQWFLPLSCLHVIPVGALPTSYACCYAGILKRVREGGHIYYREREGIEISGLGGRGRECAPRNKSPENSDTYILRSASLLPLL